MTDAQEKKSKLAEFSIFAELPEEGLSEIERVVETRTIPAGTIIFRQGDPGDSFCMVNSGKVRVFRKDPGGVELDLSILGPGDSFGEMALFSGEARSASVETLRETELAVLPKDSFDEVMRKHPNLSMAFVKQMTQWVRRGDTMLQKEAQRQFQAAGFSWFDLLIIVALGIVFGLVFNRTNPNGIPVIPKRFSYEEVTKVSPSDVYDQYKDGEAVFVDALPANFFEEGHIAGAANIPMNLFDFMYAMTLGGQEKDKPIVVYGRTISARYDEELAGKLVLHGHKNIKLLKGGLAAWKKKGYPVKE
jgi:rhodanese-related sulfurtransferase